MGVHDMVPVVDASQWSLSFLASFHVAHPIYEHYCPHTIDQLHRRVVESNAVFSVIRQLARDDAHVTEAEIKERAQRIIARMGHDMSHRTLSMMSVVIRKIFVSLFTSLKTNMLQLRRLEQDMRFSPVVFVPTHRSYMDFLLLSFVLHCAGLPCPAIAAGEDFLGMAGIAHILRWSGAFFIRRTFFDDHLYRSIFVEYVQQMVANGIPLEYFVEGTRSRSGKALTPKLGLLGTTAEPFFDNRVADINFVPVSISFERQLERELYPVELLGTPKPKESLSGLIKARSVLERDYGTVHVVFGDAISLNEHSKSIVSRIDTTRVERSEVGGDVEIGKRLAVKTLGHRIIAAHRSLTILTLTVLVAAVVPRMPKRFSLAQLDKYTRDVYNEAIKRGGNIDLYGLSWSDALNKCLPILEPHVTMSGDQEFEWCGEAESMLVYSNYRNQLAHLFIADALVMVAAGSDGDASSVYASYCELHRLMRNEFVLDETPETVEQVAARLSTLQGWIEQPVGTLRSSTLPIIDFLPCFLCGILDAYKVVAQTLVSRNELLAQDAANMTAKTDSKFIPLKIFFNLCKYHANRLVEKNVCGAEGRSLDPMKILVNWIRRCGASGVISPTNGVAKSWTRDQEAYVQSLLGSIETYRHNAISSRKLMSRL